MTQKHLIKGLKKKIKINKNQKTNFKRRNDKPHENNVDGVGGGSILVEEILLEKSGKVVVDKLNLFLEKFLNVVTPLQSTSHQPSPKNSNAPFPLFSSLEVKDTISKLQPGATGPDGIHNLMLKNLPDSFVELLTELFNRSVIESAIPSEWNKAIVIPLLKAGKDPKLVDSYRPISLTSCVAKLIERVIKKEF